MALGGKRVMMVGSEGVVLFSPASRTMEREAAISWDVPNFEEQLSQALGGKNQSKSINIIFDGADQTYRKEENIPKLSVFDRPRFVKRKLELAFPSYPIRAALEIKPPKGVKGALPSYLFVALPETEQLDRIGTALFESGAAASGFGLLPAESAPLVTHLASKIFTEAARPARWNVLIGQHETGGLRQVVVKDGNLALTRLTPTSEAGANGAAWCEEVMREFRATLTYISRFGFTADDGLNIMIVCGNVEKQFFDPASIDAGALRCVTPSEALRHIGYAPLKTDSSNYADVLHAAWISKKSKLRLPVKVPSIDRIRGPRMAAKTGTGFLVLSLVGMIGLSVQTYIEYNGLEREILDKQNQKVMLDREYGQDSKVFDALPVKPDIPKAVLAVKQLLETKSLNLPLFLVRLRQSLGPDIKLDEISVEHKVEEGLKEIEDNNLTPPVPLTPDQAADKGKISVIFKFALPDSMTLEDKVKKAETLLAGLKRDFPSFKVRILTQFGNVKREGKFAGSVGAADSAPANARDLASFEMVGAPL